MSELSDSTLTRGAVWPRITGRLAPPPKVSELIPGWLARVSPRVARRWNTSSSPPNSTTGVATSLTPRPNGTACTTTALTSSEAPAVWARAGWAHRAATATDIRSAGCLIYGPLG